MTMDSEINYVLCMTKGQYKHFVVTVCSNYATNLEYYGQIYSKGF